MSTIVFTSDLHLGITSEYAIQVMIERIAAEQPVFTVIEGDIGEGITQFSRCLALFKDAPGEKGVLLGNHVGWTYDQRASRKLWKSRCHR